MAMQEPSSGRETGALASACSARRKNRDDFCLSSGSLPAAKVPIHDVGVASANRGQRGASPPLLSFDRVAEGLGRSATNVLDGPEDAVPVAVPAVV